MQLTPKQLAETLVKHCDGKSAEETKKTINDFVKFLAESNLIDKWRKIEQAIHTAWKNHYGASQVTILSAHDLEPEIMDMLTKYAKGADVKEMTDKKLIGGAVIRVDDERIDGSILGSLRQLKQNLLASI